MLRALPTFILLVILHFYLKWAFYGPMDRLLYRRWEATEGARKAAKDALAAADARSAAYQEAIRNARGEVFAEHERIRREWQRRQAAAIEETRRKSESAIREAKDALAAEASAGRLTLAARSEALAEEIAAALLRRRAS
ncbi:MAG: hypothetical protein KIT09_21790 [Bryobacteraceae bacterium]|nr:hypothetical protein [Bryobacteraceae bacterium]